MSKRYPLAKLVLPTVVDPPRICTTVQVPNDIYHIGAFLGALRGLASAYNWADDPEHTAKAVALVWRDVFDNIVMGSCAQPGDGDMQFRQNGCVLEFSIDCVTWNTLYDPTECIKLLGGQNSPGGGPAAGDCNDTPVTIPGNGKVLLPFTLNDGDTIEATDIGGAWSDGTALWTCPDGTPYILGACIGIPGLVGGDPDATAFHMAIIAEIGSGLFVDLTQGPYTVPGGTGEVQVQLQANDSDLSNNFGSAQTNINVCRAENVPGTWCYVFDFTTGDHDFVAFGGAPGHYEPGEGWQNAAGSNGMAEHIALPFAVTVTKRTIIATSTSSIPGGNLYSCGDSAAWVDEANHVYVMTGSDVVSEFDIGGDGMGGTLGNTITIKYMKVEGTGAAPLGPSTC